MGKSRYVAKSEVIVNKKITADLPEFDAINDLEILNSDGTNNQKYESRFPRIYEMILYDKLGYNEMKMQGIKEFGITGRMMEYQIKEAKLRLKLRYEDKSDEIIEQQLARMFDLLARCKRDGNKKVERELLADLNKIYGLEQRKIDLTSNGEPISININID
jgi:hypothetical protein